jgi:AcrR family transcriptional regulator
VTPSKIDPVPPAPSSRQDEIVEAAIPIFLRFGYKKASMDAVAASAKLSRQAVYLHFPGKDALFGAVVDRLCESTRQAAHVALWRDGLSLDEQLLAAFEETMPRESMDLLAELLSTAKALVPQSVVNIDALIVAEVAARLSNALGSQRWPVAGVTVEQSAQVLQAASYGIKQQTANRAEYLAGMKSAIGLVLTAGGLATAGAPGARKADRRKRQ